MLTRAALLLIHLYQRHVSPRKGFGCAWRVHTGGPSCSAWGHRLIARRGLWRGLALLRLQLQRCSDVHHRHRPRRIGPRQLQGGYCDVPCDAPSCDMPHAHCTPGADDLCNCVSCDCGNWGSSRKRERERDD